MPKKIVRNIRMEISQVIIITFFALIKYKGHQKIIKIDV